MVYGIFELQVLEDLLRRPPGELGHDTAIRTVADKTAAKIGYAAGVAPAERLPAGDFYAALRAHLEQKMLFGKRREDKYARSRCYFIVFSANAFRPATSSCFRTSIASSSLSVGSTLTLTSSLSASNRVASDFLLSPR